jgi:molybdate transport system regulatory protein
MNASNKKNNGHENGTIRPRVKLYLSTDEIDGVFGPGKLLLLRAIEREGSLSAAARSLGRSYRKAWGDIKRAEEGLGRRLVTRSRGGRERGMMRLTGFAVALAGAWERHYKSVKEAAERSYGKFLKEIVEWGEAEQRKEKEICD